MAGSVNELLEQEERAWGQMEEVVSSIPAATEEFHREYGGGADRLLEACRIDTDHSFQDRLVKRAATALEVASRGRTSEEMVNLVKQIDEAGMRYQGDVKIGEFFEQPVEALGGQDWTRLTHYADGLLRNQHIPCAPGCTINPFRETAIEIHIGATVQDDEVSRYKKAFNTIVTENLSDQRYFTPDSHARSIKDSDVTDLYFGAIQIPSPYPEAFDGGTGYDRELAQETMAAYQDTIRQMEGASIGLESVETGHRV